MSRIIQHIVKVLVPNKLETVKLTLGKSSRPKFKLALNLQTLSIIVLAYLLHEIHLLVCSLHVMSICLDPWHFPASVMWRLCSTL